MSEKMEGVSPVVAMLVGAVGGSAEPVTGQPLWNLTVRMQGKERNLFRLKGLYTGFGANVASVGPTMAVSWAVKELLPGEGVVPSFIAGWVAGCSVSGPTEQGMTVQKNAREQSPKISFWRANANYWARRNAMAMVEGVLATGVRDGKFMVGMFWLKPQMAEWLTEQCHFHEGLSAVVAGSTSGALAAVASHPWATIAQRQRGQEQRVTMREAIKQVYAEGGFKAFWKGWKPRAGRAAIALVTIPWVADQTLKVLRDKF